MDLDNQLMIEALDLAGLGLGAVEPNPPVGAILARDGRVLGRGWHKRFGGPHAEIEALADARARGADPAGATMVVTLEPCCHAGKTGPCTEALIEAKVARVVAALEDPDEHVGGQGFQRLRAAGVEVDVGCQAERARRLLGPYIKLRTTARPWVIGKWAQTLDGRSAARTGHSRWISGEQSRRRVHELRAICDAVMVGAGTALADNPELTNRSGAGRAPARVVVDEGLRVSEQSKLVATIDRAPLLIATVADAVEARPERARALTDAGAELAPLPGRAGGVDLPALLDELGRRRWTRILLEGGPTLMGAFVAERLLDELWVFVAPRLLGHEGLPAVRLHPVDRVDQGPVLPAPEVEAVGQDLLLRYRLGD